MIYPCTRHIVCFQSDRLIYFQTFLFLSLTNHDVEFQITYLDTYLLISLIIRVNIKFFPRYHIPNMIYFLLIILKTSMV